MASTVGKISRTVAMTNAATLISAGASVLVGWNLINPITTAAYLKLYNAASAGAVTVGSTTPVKTLLIPPGPGLFFLSNEDKFQQNFNLGIVAAVVTGIADDNSTAPGTGCYVEIMYENQSL
jgi:hypothetical protein